VRSLLPKIKKYFEQTNLQRGLLFVSFFSILFFSGSHFAHATILGEIGDALLGAFNVLLYGVLIVLSWGLSAVVTLFGYAVDAGNLSGPNGMLNLQATYDMWKFVRDIINVGFIFGLLFIAFAFIFQIHGYSDKKVILKLIIAALLVNFSFPLARVLIDFANVPMYFFLQMILGNNGSGAISSALSASQLSSILVPASMEDAASKATSLLILNIIFLFMFTITLGVLAIQFLIRMIALVILVILSPIGFAASGIPGLKSYGGKWWDNFLKYCLFGPAAAFMLVLATNFLAAVNGGGQYEGFRQLASQNSQDTSLIASMGLFAIPIVMLWFTVGIAGKMSVAGADIGKKYGQGTISKTGNYLKKKSYNNRYTRGFKKGAMERAEKTPVLKSFTPKASKLRSESGEALMAGLIGGGLAGRQKAADKLKQQRISERVKENKDKGVTESVLKNQLKDGDDVTKKAAALSLAENGSIKNAETLKSAIEALKTTVKTKEKDATGKPIEKTTIDQDMLRKVLDKSKDDAFGDLDLAAYKKMIDTDDAKDSDGKFNENIENLNSKLKKAGKVDVLIDYDVSNADPAAKQSGDAFKAAFKERVGKMNNADLIKQKGLTEMAGFEEAAIATFGRGKRIQKIVDKAYEDGSGPVIDKWEGVKGRMPKNPEEASTEAKAKKEGFRERAQAARDNKPKPKS
jgi:hypothetical protein